MFGAVKDLGRRLQQLNGNLLMKIVMSEPSIQAQIIDLNQSQLYDQGVDAKGVTTGEYSLATIYGTPNFEGKIEKNQPYDHVTLKDSGHSYDSMRVVTEDTAFIITGDFPYAIKQAWPDALGLTLESRKEIIPEVTESLRSEIKKAILKP